LSTGDNDIIKARGRLYRSLMEPFQFPTATLTEQFISGGWGRGIAATVELLNTDLHYDLILTDIPILEVDHDQYQVEFISLHEVGMGGAPCPLHSGHYSKDRMRTLEEVVRFYHFFDFEPDRSPDKFPDHITTELEFVAYLADRQLTAASGQGDMASPLRAQRDFVTRQLASWLPQLTKLVGERSQIRFFDQIVNLLNAYAACDQRYLDTSLGEINLENSGEYQHG